MEYQYTKDGREIASIETYGVGTEAGPILDWFDSVFYALAKLRSSDLKLDKSRDQKTLNDLFTCINDLVHRLEPRMNGLITALIRAHHEAGGSHQELATAMDVVRSTASTRSRKIRLIAPTRWEEWARGEISSMQTWINAENIQPGYVLVADDKTNEQVFTVDVNEDQELVYVTAGPVKDAVFTYRMGEAVNVVPKVKSTIQPQQH